MATLWGLAPAGATVQYAVTGGNAQRSGVAQWLGPTVHPIVLGAGVSAADTKSLGAMAVDAAGVAYVVYSNSTVRAISFDAATQAPTILWTAGDAGSSIPLSAPALDKLGQTLLVACPFAGFSAAVCALRTTNGSRLWSNTMPGLRPPDFPSSRHNKTRHNKTSASFLP